MLKLVALLDTLNLQLGPASLKHKQETVLPDAFSEEEKCINTTKGIYSIKQFAHLGRTVAKLRYAVSISP